MLTGDWEQLTVVAPREVTIAVLRFLEQRFGYRHVPDGIDWSVWERAADFSYADVGPHSPVTTNRYRVDWRQGEGRGDVAVPAGEGS